ncbi:homeobox protein goosecoid-2 isoform X1 [Ictidomys tridecemlineatus]
MAVAGGAASRRGPGRPCPFSIEHILSSLPERSPPTRAARPPLPSGQQSPTEPGEPGAPEIVSCACCCCCGPRAASRRTPEAAAGLGARLPWPLRLGPAAPLPLAAAAGGSATLPGAGGPVPQRRTRRHRTIFSEEQLQALEALFVQNQYPDVGTRERLAGRIHLREERVEVGAGQSHSGLVQEPQGQVETPKARISISVSEAPARDQETSQGEMLMGLGATLDLDHDLWGSQRERRDLLEPELGEHFGLFHQSPQLRTVWS